MAISVSRKQQFAGMSQLSSRNTAPLYPFEVTVKTLKQKEAPQRYLGQVTRPTYGYGSFPNRRITSSSGSRRTTLSSPAVPRARNQQFAEMSKRIKSPMSSRSSWRKDKYREDDDDDGSVLPPVSTTSTSVSGNLVITLTSPVPPAQGVPVARLHYKNNMANVTPVSNMFMNRHPGKPFCARSADMAARRKAIASNAYSTAMARRKPPRSDSAASTPQLNLAKYREPPFESPRTRVAAANRVLQSESPSAIRIKSAQKDGKVRFSDPEASSQKRVRFSDQMGLPLVRNLTPSYRKKHAYILRWLETAHQLPKADES